MHDSPATPVHRGRRRTSASRHRLVDALVARRFPAVLAAPPGARFVDVGIGLDAGAARAFAAAVRRGAPGAAILVVDRDPDVVRAARAALPPDVDVARVDVAVDALPGARLLRVMNVLRSGTADAARVALARLVDALDTPGLLIEGSSDGAGGLAAAFVVEKTVADTRWALLLATDGDGGASPWRFRDVLPRLVRRDVRPGTDVHARLARLAVAFDDARARGERDGVRALAAAGDTVAATGAPLEVHALGADAVALLWWLEGAP